MAAKPKSRTPPPGVKGAKGAPEERVLAAALEIAEETGWDAVRLRDVATRAGVLLVDLHRHYRDADAIANAWFRKGLDAMLAPPPRGFHLRPPKRRIETMMVRWFAALAPHRRVTAQMLGAKMWPFHPHHYVPMAFDLSRLIQWLRDAAGLDATGRRRQVEEIGLSALFVATLAVWCRDETPGQERTRAFLAHRLDHADRLMARLFR